MQLLKMALWLLMAGQRTVLEAGKILPVPTEVHTTDTGGRIAFAPEGSVGEWRRIAGTDMRGWWLGDLVDSVTATGSVVETFSRGNAFSLVITWTHMA